MAGETPNAIMYTSVPRYLMYYRGTITMRTRMPELFADETVIPWWLPNDEGLNPLVQNIRAIADKRNDMAVSTQRESLQQIPHVFSNRSPMEAF
ncbi:uncharacterized protein B0H64DRAFT_395279 [Chaetomium fimeti]|uniref:Uncharacterized protein n=1 Tax=Chaetomium fimeti TaxID=1854472 RepID=A0AAE0LSA4_9PEZI|nr:hypothetical protein B0H64DRAFT_395279 [Chaetomium fimeti]